MVLNKWHSRVANLGIYIMGYVLAAELCMYIYIYTNLRRVRCQSVSQFGSQMVGCPMYLSLQGERTRLTYLEHIQNACSDYIVHTGSPGVYLLVTRII